MRVVVVFRLGIGIVRVWEVIIELGHIGQGTIGFSLGLELVFDIAIIEYDDTALALSKLGGEFATSDACEGGGLVGGGVDGAALNSENIVEIPWASRVEDPKFEARHSPIAVIVSFQTEQLFEIYQSANSKADNEATGAALACP